MATEWEDPGPPLAEEDIQAVERLLGIELPQALRAHYARINGGYPEKNIFVSDDGECHDVASFLCINSKAEAYTDAPTLEEWFLDFAVRRRIIPAAFIPFARNSGDDLYCIHASAGEIFFFAMDHADEPDRALTYVARSLQAFIDGLTSGEEAYAAEES